MGTAWSDQRLLSIRPAPTSSSTASAICTTTSALRKRWRAPPLETPWPPSLSDSVRSMRSARNAGARLKSTLVRSATTAVKTRTEMSSPTLAMRGMSAGFHHATSRTPAYARPRPTTALAAVSTRLSVRSWRTIRIRLAPSAAAHGHLALPRLRAREQQVGDVGAGDEQQEADRTEEQPDRAADGADDLVGEREHDRVELHLNRIEPFARHGAGDPAQLVGGLPHRRAWLQSAGGVEAVAAVIGSGRIHLQRRPQLGRLGIAKVRRQNEARRHDAHDFERRRR